MSDPLDELPLPPRPPGWQPRLTEWAEALDLTPTRLGLGVLLVLGLLFAGWKVLAPPDLPPEMRVPLVSTSLPGGAEGTDSPSSSDSAGAAGDAAPGAGTGDAQLVVHVAGAVVSPGVQRLASGARVIDAVEAAGGSTPDAELHRINLAAVLQDGQQVYVPRQGEVGPPVAAGGAGPGASPDAPVDLNTASAEQLAELPGIGPALAEAIVAHRQEHGRFGSVDQLEAVRGIGVAKLEQLRPLVTV